MCGCGSGSSVPPRETQREGEGREITKKRRYEIPRTVTLCFHPHTLEKMIPDDGYICNMLLLTGYCKSGITGYHQSHGITSWRCNICHKNTSNNPLNNTDSVISTMDICQECIGPLYTESELKRDNKQFKGGTLIRRSEHHNHWLIRNYISGWKCDGSCNGSFPKVGGNTENGSNHKHVQKVEYVRRWTCVLGCDYDLCSECLDKEEDPASSTKDAEIL